MILALETATSACSAALFGDDGQLLDEVVSLDGPAHSQRLLGGVHAVLLGAGTTIDAVDTVVVSLGPGMFTGLRIGVATARALAQALDLRLAGVPTLEALAGALAGGERGASAPYLVALIDGRRGEVFAACFRRAADGVALEPEVGLAVVAADDLAGFLGAWPGAVVGGDGAVLYADRLPPVVVHDLTVAVPTAAMIGRTWLAGTPRALEGPAAVLPVYGRRPDAKRRAGSGAPS